MLTEFGVVPSQLDKEDFYELIEVLHAQSREERPMSAEDAHKKLAKIFG